MADFEKWKDKAVVAVCKAADKSAEFAQTVGESAKVVGKIAKLKTDMAVERDKSRKKITGLGELYYELYKDAPAPEFSQLVTEINEIAAMVAQKEAEVIALKKELAKDSGEAVVITQEDSQ